MWEIEIIDGNGAGSSRRFKSKNKPLVSEQVLKVEFTCASTNKPYAYVGYRFNLNGPEVPFAR